MFTYDGLKKINCTLQGTNVVIDGVPHEIICLKEATSEKSKTVMAPVILAVATLILGGEGSREFIGGDRVGSLFLLVPFVLLVPLTLYLIRYTSSQIRCRSLWRLNFFHMLCVEKGDDQAIESILNNLPVPDESTLTKPVNQFFTKKDVAILIILAIVCLLAVKGLVPAWSALLFWGYAAWLRIKDIIWDFKHQQWQSPTND